MHLYLILCQPFEECPLVYSTVNKQFLYVKNSKLKHKLKESYDES
jgi:hypothetical protein